MVFLYCELTITSSTCVVIHIFLSVLSKKGEMVLFLTQEDKYPRFD